MLPPIVKMEMTTREFVDELDNVDKQNQPGLVRIDGAMNLYKPSHTFQFNVQIFQGIVDG